PYTTMVAIVSPPRLRGQAVSWSLLWVTLGALLVAPIIGGIGDTWGQRAAVGVLGILVTAAGAVEVTARQLVRRDVREAVTATERVLNYFPILREYYDLPAANLSGGQQQMLTLGQALLAEPKLLMIDELSLGLAPVIVDQLLGTVRQLAADGVTIILVEQSVN